MGPAKSNALGLKKMEPTSAFLTDADLTTCISCRCGKCRMTIVDPQPRAQIECFHPDSLQMFLAAEKAGGPAVPGVVRTLSRGVGKTFWSDAVIVSDDSEELLAFSKLRSKNMRGEEGPHPTDQIMALSTCCCTPMIVSDGSPSLWTTPLGAPVVTASTNINIEPVETSLYAFVGHCPVASLSALVAANGAVACEEDPQDSEDFNEATALGVDEQYRVAPGSRTFGQLLRGKDLFIDDSCFAEARQGRPASADETKTA